MGKRAAIDLLWFDVQWTGPSTFDQPLRMRIGRAGDKEELKYTSYLSRGQIIDPRMFIDARHPSSGEHDLDFLVFRKGGQVSESELAQLVWEYLKERHNSAEEGVCWVGNFFGYAGLHQLRSFLIRHGFAPYYGNKESALVFDSSYLVDDVVDIKILLAHLKKEKDLFFDLWKAGKPFIAHISARPRALGSNFWKEYPRPTLYQSCFYPVGVNKGGLLVLDLLALKIEPPPYGRVEALTKHLIWINGAASIFVPKDSASNYKGTLRMSHENVARSNLPKEVREMIEGFKVEDYFRLVTKSFSGIEPEADIYNIPLDKLHALRNAIYHDNFEALFSNRDPVLMKLYERHLMRKHSWSKGCYADSNSGDDLSAKRVLRDYVNSRYVEFNSRSEVSIPPTSIETLKRLRKKVLKRWQSNFSSYLTSTDAYQAIRDG